MTAIETRLSEREQHATPGHATSEVRA